MHSSLLILLSLRCATVAPTSFSPRLSESCLGPGFTQTIPPQDQLSQYSTTVLQPGDRAIYTTLSFRCNGTLESLTIPSQVRGSDYPIVGQLSRTSSLHLEVQCSEYHFIVKSTQRQRTSTANSIELDPGDVHSFNLTVTLQMAIQAGDVLGFLVTNRGGGDRIEHLPLLYKPGPTPGSFTPIIIPNFTPTSGPPPSESSVEPSPSGPFDGELGGTVNRMCLWKVNVCVLPFCRSVCRSVI